MPSRAVVLVIAAGLWSGVSVAQPPEPLPDGLRDAPQPAAQAARKELSAEQRGDIFMARKMYREAIETFSEGSRKDPVLQNKIGIAYHQMMQLDRAKKYYQAAVKLKPDYMEAENNLGTVYYAAKNYRKAINCYLKALKMIPENARAASLYSNLGTAYFARKRYDDATKAYETALRLDPNVFESHASAGVILQERNIEERANFHFSLAKLYAKNGRTELALQYLRKSLEEGFKDRKKLAEAPEFKQMQDLPEFKELLALEPRVL